MFINKVEPKKCIMKTLSTISLIAVLSGFAVASQAQLTVLSENFDEQPLGPTGMSYNYDGGGNPDVNIVSPGEGGTGNAWQMTRTVADPTTLSVTFFSTTYSPALWMGGDTANMNLTGNTDPNLADYTLSFDMSTDGDSMSGDACILTLYAGDGSGTSVYNFISMPNPGTGYETFSMSLGSMTAGFGGTLNPTVSSVYLDVDIFNFNGAGYTATVNLDNINIVNTVVPEPSTYATLLGGLGLLVGWLRFRRVS